MFTFDPISLLLIIFFSAFIPGTLIALPFFKKVNLNLLEKLFLGFILGMVLPAFVLFLLSLIGIDFSFMLALSAILIITIIGAVWTYKEKAWEDLKMPNIKEIKEDYWKYIGYALLLIFIFLAFFIRVQSYSPIYQELDPYWYMYGTQQILTEGSVPLTDTTAWYPLVESSHRSVPVLQFIEASWYSLYTQGGVYDNYLLSVICSFYPPLVAGLLVFCAYLFCKKEFGNNWGLVAAGLMAFLPSTIMKMAAGVSEAQPMALFAMFFFLATLVLALKEKQKKLFVLAGLAASTVILGATSLTVVYLVFAGFFVLQSMLYFIHNQKDELYEFIKSMGILVLFILISVLLYNYYRFGNIVKGIKDTGTILSIGALVVSYILYHSLLKVKLNNLKRIVIPIGIFILIFILFFLPFTSDILKSLGEGFLRQATYDSPLWKTIQEQASAGISFEGYLGAIGADFGSCQKGADLSLGSFFCWINYIFRAFDVLFKHVFDLPLLETSFKNGGFTLIFLFGALLAFIYELYENIKTKKHISLFFLLFLFIFPISYVGLNKAKYSIYLSLAVVIAAVWTFAFICKVFDKFFKSKEGKYYAKLLILIIASLFVVSEFFSFLPDNPTMAQSVLSVSLETRYQDNPEALMEKFERLCDKTGDQNLCNAVLNKNHWNSSINNRYNQQLCLYSIFSEEEILGNQTISNARQIGASLKCSKIADYWISSMEWISEETPNTDSTRIISWWDYGHWINFFGERNTVLRNEHSSHEMIERTAFAYLHGNETDLINTMKDYGSEYALFDSELLLSGSSFGGKYGALNYLGCAYLNETTVLNDPGQSECEQNNLWEEVYLPTEPDLTEICTISYEENKKGTIGYYGGLTVVQTQEGTQQYRAYLTDKKYCISEKGVMYFLDKKDDEGNLIIQGGILQPQGTIYSTKGDVVLKATVIYMDENYTITDAQNNTITINNWENRVESFYDSNLYKAFILDELEGFEKVYDNGNVKIFKKK
ncbi:MAG: STT3 domain-containing protein [Candidatus Micrarchaeia archaeon]|jgi:asparagine N-glycosylation enzyme membrane subunit Stt3